ncbi:MAG: carboxypeptidase M32 [Coriobacteriales bacterium]|nr:carboxypeptidase M32 [Coriobacteriales bacterium]
MSNKSTNDDKPLNIPSFLARPARPMRATPRDEEVDAVMKSVHEAVSLDLDDMEEPPLEGLADSTEEQEDTQSRQAAILNTPDESAVPEVDPEPAPKPEPEPTTEEDLEHLARIERHLYAHRYACAELEAFGETIDPPNVTADRAEALAVLMEEVHELLADDKVGKMLDRLSTKSDEIEPMEAAQVRVLIRDRNQLVGVPSELQSQLVRLQSESYDVWLRAKAQNDWNSFAPCLDKLVDLQRKIALARNPDADPYDTLLDEYEQGANRAFYNSFFARVKQCVVPLLTAISKSGRSLSTSCVAGRFDVMRQWELSRDVAYLEGINEDAHYLTTTEHPFSMAMTSNYAITATNLDPDDLMGGVYTMLHEIGHNMYEQGVNPQFNRTSLKGGTSMGMHEAQSRFFENYVGRDRAFMDPLLDLLKQRFRGQLSRVTANQLYLAVNSVSPSLIRTEADELTYPLHVLIRYEIEQLLFDGSATARDVPALWASRYRRYIGATVTNDTEGALQDVHWAHGAFGYFPTYALGGAYAAQLKEKMISDGVDWEESLSSGDLAPIREWLRERVWQFGRSKDPGQIIEDACGEKFNPRYYANYLTHKYATLYGIN